MRELPLLACDRVALALREGRQTQHRVPVRPRALWLDTAGRWRWEYSQRRTSQALWTSQELERAMMERAPWQPGDSLYVRECHAFLMPTRSGHREADERIVRRPEDDADVAIWYRASGSMGILPRIDPEGPRWSPSIHMPKWAARTWLKVRRVWVEQVQDISEEDARAEGVERCGGFMGAHAWRNYGSEGPASDTARDSFASLWESIYPGSWERNDWVWACEWPGVDAQRSGVTT